MVRFKFLAQFPVDHLAHPIVSSLILFLCQFAAFVYYVIDNFVSISTWPTSAVLLRLIYCFAMVGPYGVVLCCYQNRFSFSLKVSLSYPRPGFLVWDITCLSLKTSAELFFFPLLFSNYLHSADPRVVRIVFGGCDQSFSSLFYVVFESLYRCVNAVFNDGKFSSFLFSWHIVCQRHFRNVSSYAWSLVFLFTGPFVKVLLWFTSWISRVSYEGYSPGIYPFDKVPGI